MKARAAKKLLKKLSVVEVKPGDVLIWKYPAWADGTMLDLTNLKKMFPNNEVLAMPDDMDVEVIRKGTP